MNQVDDNHPAIANLGDMVKLRYGARELTGFPKIQARQMLAGGHKSRPVYAGKCADARKGQEA